MFRQRLTEQIANRLFFEWRLSLILRTRENSGMLVNLPSPCRWAGCTGCQTAGLRRSETGRTGCATPRCFRPTKYCSSASRPTRSESGRTAPDRRKHAPGPELATSRPPQRLPRRQQQRRGSRRSYNWLPLLRPDRRSLLLHRPLQTLQPCSLPTTPGDRTASLYTAEWFLIEVKCQHFTYKITYMSHQNHNSMEPTLPSSMAEWKRCVKVLEEQIHLMIAVTETWNIICTSVSCITFKAQSAKSSVHTLWDQGKPLPNPNRFYFLRGPQSIHKHELT